MALCETLNEQLGATYEHISESTTKVTIAYHPKFAIDQYETLLLQKLETMLTRMRCEVLRRMVRIAKISSCHSMAEWQMSSRLVVRHVQPILAPEDYRIAISRNGTWSDTYTSS